MANEFTALVEKLEGLEGETMRRIQRKALNKVGDIMKDAVDLQISLRRGGKVDMPGGLLSPGELKASIKKTVRVPTDDQILAGKAASVMVAARGHEPILVANWLENGHVARASKRRPGAARFVPAYPFVRPAFDLKHEEAEAAYAESVAADVKKALE